jgi:MazG family protein
MENQDPYLKETLAFARLLEIMDTLRTQCPWDKKQTFQSLRNLTLEEAYELADEILKGDMKGIQEEIGDLMLHMVFYARIASETGSFDIGDAIHSVCEKLISRHPHIYGDTIADTEEAVKKNWEQLKLREGKKSVLDGVPDSMPALIKAYRMQEKTAQVGFEWDHKSQVWEKVLEELGEFQAALNEGAERREEEFGDLLFALVNYARFEKIDPETALAKANNKFKSRFEFIERGAPKPLVDMTLEEMDTLWDQAKHAEKKG